MADNFIVPLSPTAAERNKDDKSAFLAGGTEINRLDSLVRQKVLIQLGHLGMDSINEAEIDGKPYVRIGAMATFTDMLESPLIPDYLKQACRFLSSMVRRNMATIGGNVALARDDSYLIPTLIASGAIVEFVSERVLTLEKYVKKHAQYANRLITAIFIDPQAPVKSKRYANTSSGHAYLTVAVCNSDVVVQVKNGGLFVTKMKVFSEEPCIRWAEHLKGLKTDMYGSIPYKKYLAGVTIAMLGKKEAAK